MNFAKDIPRVSLTHFLISSSVHLIIVINFIVARVHCTPSDNDVAIKQPQPLPAVGTPCVSPEVLVNGSPSPDILDMVTGGKSSSFTSIEEILFVGQLSPSDEKRICKIKCIKGVWVGPMCASKPGSDIFEHPTIKDCQLKPKSTGLVITHNGSQIVLDRVHTFSDQSIIKVRCNEVGLSKLTGYSELKCIKGVWDHPLPKCEETTLQTNFSLDSPPSIVYSVTSGGVGITDSGELLITPGTLLHLDCLFSRSNGDPEWTWTMAQRQYPIGWAVSEESQNWKYRLSVYYTNEKDSGQFKCTTPRGHFNSISIKVKEKNCPLPSTPLNGRLLDTGHYQTGDYVQYFCNSGYIMIGDGLSICLENGIWSKPTPICVASCEFPGEPTNGYLIPTKFHYNIGETISIVCKPDYRLQGSTILTCNSDGHWSAPLPFCKPTYSLI